MRLIPQQDHSEQNNTVTYLKTFANLVRKTYICMVKHEHGSQK